ncbi:Pyruvate decarboxylase [Madurella fahalii]|uniref:Pyruvate decarboxylase n=1 Tax=Madurella fahalii TaxID=1157608 RepID=A0ABQ0GJT0_9PEZI
MAKKITCCAVAVPRAEEAPRLIDRAIRQALLARKPCYIEIPTNLAGAGCVWPGPISAVTDPVASDKGALEAAADCAAEYLRGKLKPLILVGPKLRRAGGGTEQGLVRLAEAMGCAVAVQPAAKGMFPETHPQFAGVFWGQVSTGAADAIVHWADALLCVGTVFTDYNTVGWTALRPADVPLMAAEMDHVAFPGAHFGRVRMAEFLPLLAARVAFNNATMVEYARLLPDPPRLYAAPAEAPLSRREVVRQVQAMLGPESTLFVDTGDSWFNGMQLRLPEGAQFEIEMQWGHIGWSVPAAFGYALRQPERRTIVMIGDGSFQVTAQEVSQMGYALLVEAFNAGEGKAKGLKAVTAGKLEKADDCSRELITWGHYVAAANGRPPKHGTE